MLRAGHKGLFVDRLDAGVANSAGDDFPRLVAEARLQYYMRNRTLDAGLGRPLQMDPNATALVLIVSAARNGAAFGASVNAFDLSSMYGDGPNLYGYLGSNPWTHHDPLGLWIGGLASFGALGAEGVLRGLRGGLASMIGEYVDNMEFDLDWAMDMSLPDD